MDLLVLLRCTVVQDQVHDTKDVPRIVDPPVRSPLELHIVFLQNVPETLTTFQRKSFGIELLKIHMLSAKRPIDVMEGTVSFELSTIVFSPGTEHGLRISIHPLAEESYCCGELGSFIDMMLFNPRQRLAKLCQSGVAKRTYERLKLINWLKRLTMRHDCADFDHLHLITSELTTVTTGSFQIDNQPVVRFVFHGALDL